MSKTNSRSAGFSLLEVIVSLAIFSALSLILFQSLLTQSEQADRINSHISSSFEGLSNERFVDALLSHAIDSWQDRPEERFRGTASTIFGISDCVHCAGDTGVFQFMLELRPGETETVAVLVLDGEERPIASFSADMKFWYFGFDKTWREEWPISRDDPYFQTSIDNSLRGARLPDFIRIGPDKTPQSKDLIIQIENEIPLPG